MRICVIIMRFLFLTNAKVMYDFEKMKKCKHFFEKTRKKFVLLSIFGCFFNKSAGKGDFCLRIVPNALLSCAICQLLCLILLKSEYIIVILLNLMYLRHLKCY